MTNTTTTKRLPTGVVRRHALKCPSRAGGKCGKPCVPRYEGWVYSARDHKKIRETFATVKEAAQWRAAGVVGVPLGTMRAPTPATLREAASAWIDGARDGTIRTRSGDAYKPSAIRGYDGALNGRVLSDLGGHKLSAITRRDLQDLVDRLVAENLDPSTIRNALMPLRAIYRRAVSRGDVAINPTTGLELPSVRGKRDRIASPVEAAALLEALAETDRAVWATAMYAGLRLGELRALREEDVDLQEGVIRVERSWDVVAGVIEPKSRAGRRTVPIVAVLRVHLAAHKLRRTGGELFFGDAGRPFNRDPLVARAGRAWSAANVKRRESEIPELVPIGMHECRHTCASIFIAAGVNVKALSSYLGHASITITMDRYGHLMPGNELEAVQLVDRYMALST